MVKKICTLIGSDKGGVGKSLLAQIYVLAHDRASDVERKNGYELPKLSVVEIDNQKRLSSLLGSERMSLSLPAMTSLEEMLRDRHAYDNFLNKVYEVWSAGDSLTDLGANVTTQILEWMKYNDIEGFAKADGILFRFVAIATPDDLALESAVSALVKARAVLGSEAELFVVLNDTMGVCGFKPYTVQLKRLYELSNEIKFEIINIPFCDSILLEWGRAKGKTILNILNNPYDFVRIIQNEGNVGIFTLRVNIKRFYDWVRNIQESLYPLFNR